MTRLRRAESVIALSLCLWSVLTHAATEATSTARQTVEALESALQTLRVSGDLVRFDGETLQSYAVTHPTVADNRDPGFIVQALDAADVEDGVAALKPVAVSRFVRFPAAALLRAAEWYGLEDCPARVIAGRHTRCVRVVPKDPHRLAYTLWMDGAQSVLLGFVVHGSSGEPLEFVQFTRAVINPSSPAVFRAGVVPATPGEGQTLPRWTPDGFVLQSNHPSDGGHTMRFSDGVTGFSLFITPLIESAATTGESRRGASVVADRIVRGSDGRDYLVTLAGEIPMATARRVLLGVQPSS